ncbi:hypothetical protein MXD63_10000 [Frankia sp. Cpl3]|nr:hypothetical protein [Parafrankia colletiae]MCK9900405.1 hypothetical protein [Frankia sp. Cpl3]
MTFRPTLGALAAIRPDLGSEQIKVPTGGERRKMTMILIGRPLAPALLDPEWVRPSQPVECSQTSWIVARSRGHTAVSTCSSMHYLACSGIPLGIDAISSTLGNFLEQAGT